MRKKLPFLARRLTAVSAVVALLFLLIWIKSYIAADAWHHYVPSDPGKHFWSAPGPSWYSSFRSASGRFSYEWADEFFWFTNPIPGWSHEVYEPDGRTVTPNGLLGFASGRYHVNDYTYLRAWWVPYWFPTLLFAYMGWPALRRRIPGFKSGN